MVVVKRIVLLFLLLFTFNLVSAQIVSDIKARQEKNIIILQYRLNCVYPCNISMDISFNDGISWYTPAITNLVGDFGKSIFSGEHEIRWEVLKEFDEFVYNNIKFRINALPMFGSKYNFFNVGFIPNNYNDLANISFAIGNQKYFISTKFSLNGFSNSTYSCDLIKILNFNSNNTDNVSFNNVYKVERLSFLIGKFFMSKKNNILKPLFAIGYGSYNALWGYNVFNASNYSLVSSGFANNTSLSTKGIETQIGLKYNHSHFNFITSFNMIFSSNRNYYDCNFGIGINFIKRKL